MSYFAAIKGLISNTVARNVRIDSTTHALSTIEYGHHEIHSGSHFFVEGHTTLGVAGTFYIKLVTPNVAKWSHMFWAVSSSGILTVTLDEDATGGMAGGAVATIHANNRNINCWTGTHTGGDDEATVLTDGTKAWDADALIGYQVYNTTDGSSGIITDNDGTTVTVAALAGGTGDDWDTDDTYEINTSTSVVTIGVATCTGYIQRVSEHSFGSKQSGGAINREDELILKPNTVYCKSYTSDTAANIMSYKMLWYEHTDRN